MADVYEQNLTQKSTLTTSDFIRVVGSDNVSYKQLVSDVAKKIIENYTGSSLAGSSQSVKTVLDWLGWSPASGSTKADVFASIDARVSVNGFRFGYLPNTQAALIGLPNTSHFYIFSANSVNYRSLICVPIAGDRLWLITKQNGTWGEPTRYAQQADVDALTTKKIARAYTVTCSAGGYTLIDNYTDLGIDKSRITGYMFTSGSYLIELQFATEGVYLFSATAISAKNIGVTYLYQ